jgi:hypothetical protein
MMEASRKRGRQLNIETEVVLVADLKKRLIDEGMNVRKWFELMATAYLKFPGYDVKTITFRSGEVIVSAKYATGRKVAWTQRIEEWR